MISYLAIPTHNFIENIKPYMHIDSTYILEKPHGHSKEDFENIKSFINEHELKVLYIDHYTGKDVLNHIKTPNKLKSIKLKIYETADMNERITYFDTVGIIGDMYQSHCLILFATILAKYFETSREMILKELSMIKPDVEQLFKCLDYTGLAPTQCKITMVFNDVYLEADIAKMSLKEEKSIYINDKLWKLDTGADAYENILKNLKNGNTELFLNESEVDSLWNHTCIME